MHALVGLAAGLYQPCGAPHALLQRVLLQLHQDLQSSALRNLMAQSVRRMAKHRWHDEAKRWGWQLPGT